MKKAHFWLVLLPLSTALCNPVYAADVAVMMSTRVDPHQKALQGFEETLRHRIVDRYDMKGDLDRGRKILAKVQTKTSPDLMFTVGAPALQVVSHRTNLQAVYAMVFNPASIIRKRRTNIAGIDMNVPVEETIRLFKELSPDIRRIGVVYNPARTGHLVTRATPVARAKGLELVTMAVASPKEAVLALNSLQNKIDALWILPDETVLAADVVQYMLALSYRNRIPVLGLSKRHSAMGAVLAVSFGNFTDIGRQAGNLANRILRGEKPPSVPTKAVQQTKLTVNLKAAQKLGMELPKSILEMADNAVQAPVYKEGDWWVFRVKRAKGPPEVYRVTYKDGKFQSDEPDFLTVNNNPDSISWLPLISVNLEGPKMKWFDFPLLPGRKWSFRYKHSRYRWGGASGRWEWREVAAEVIGPVLQPVETPAGTFVATEIRRTMDRGRKTFEFTYFYSPETKSIVRVILDGDHNHPYEMELVDYGPRAPVVTPVVNLPVHKGAQVGGKP